jgi:hypothetical protein
MTPYLDRYPALSPTEAWERFADNTLDYYYPLGQTTKPRGGHL